MRQILNISGPASIVGEVKVAGAKNAALPLLIASLINDQPVTLNNLPKLSDINLLLELIQSLGADLERNEETVCINAQKINTHEPSPSLIKSFRASFLTLAPILARMGQAKIVLPGGDIIGKRPIDIHLEGLAAMGADISLSNSMIIAKAKQLKPTNFKLAFPSVGASQQLLIAATTIEGTSVLDNLAQEPEVASLCSLLGKMGASLEGVGTSCVKISGTKNFKACEHEIIGDRIEAATFLLAAMVSGGEIVVNGFEPKHLGALLDLIQAMGGIYSVKGKSITLKAPKTILPVEAITSPYPGLATDIQPQLTSALTQAAGISSVTENMFENRFAHLDQLAKMGADIQIDGKKAIITGPNKLKGTLVSANDIRAAAALLIAALVAEGETQIAEPQHFYRGYSNLVSKLNDLGVDASYQELDRLSPGFVGC